MLEFPWRNGFGGVRVEAEAAHAGMAIRERGADRLVRECRLFRFFRDGFVCPRNHGDRRPTMAKRDLRLVSEFPVAARPSPLPPEIEVRNRIESTQWVS